MGVRTLKKYEVKFKNNPKHNTAKVELEEYFGLDALDCDRYTLNVYSNDNDGSHLLMNYNNDNLKETEKKYKEWVKIVKEEEKYGGRS